MRILIYSICLSLLTSCDQLKTSPTQPRLAAAIEITDSLELAIDPNEYFRSIQNHLIEENGHVYLIRESRMKSSIEIYDWTARTKSHRITFEGDQASGISNFGSAAFYPFSQDSILLFDLDGNIFFTSHGFITDIAPGKKGRRFYGESAYKPTRIKDHLFVHSTGNYRQEHPQFFDTFAIMKFDLNTKQITSIPVTYPEPFKKDCWAEHHWDVPFTSNDQEQLVLSFSMDPVIKIFNPDLNKVVATHHVASTLVEKIEPLPNCQLSDEVYFHHLKSQARYLSLTYDPFKKLYYRLVALPVSGKTQGKRDFEQVQPFSLMILDQNFELVSEKKFPAEKYDPRDFFVTREGLWISRNNENSKEFDHSRLLYDLIEIEA